MQKHRTFNPYATRPLAMRPAALGAVLLALGLTASCSLVEDAVYRSRQAPDEFAVYTNPPLSLPPDYDLRPPASAGAGNGATPKRDAEQALFGATGRTDRAPAGASGGVVELLEKTGALNATADIRQAVNRETSILVEEDRNLTDRLLFWQKAEPFGAVIDAAREQSRLQENEALGKPLGEGDVPVVAP